VPINLDLSSFPKHLRGPAAYLFNLIKWRFGTRKVNARGFTNLKHAYIIKVIPPRLWRELRAYLLKRGIIEEDGDVNDGKCRGYRLAAAYKNGHYVVCTDPNVNAGIHRLRFRKERETFQPVHHWLQDNLHRVHFDLDQALEIVPTLKPKKANRRHPWRPSIPEHREQRAEYFRLLSGADRWEITIDDYGRVHSAITRLERAARECLSIDGEEIQWIDLKNSQPLFLAIFAGMWLNLSKTMKNRTLAKVQRDSGRGRKGKGREGRTAQASITTNKDSQSIMNQLLVNTNPYNSQMSLISTDYQRFLSRCQRGVYYERLMNERERARPKHYRDQFKVRNMVVFFGRNKSTNGKVNKLRSRFKRKYPTLWRVLREVKNSNHRHAAHILQRMESQFFIHTVCRRLMEEYRTMPIITVHDCLGTTAEHVETVKLVIMDEFKKLGVTPKLDVKGIVDDE
jgi:hypothetical protein